VDTIIVKPPVSGNDDIDKAIQIIYENFIRIQKELNDLKKRIEKLGG